MDRTLYDATRVVPKENMWWGRAACEYARMDDTGDCLDLICLVAPHDDAIGDCKDAFHNIRIVHIGETLYQPHHGIEPPGEYSHQCVRSAVPEEPVRRRKHPGKRYRTEVDAFIFQSCSGCLRPGPVHKPIDGRPPSPCLVHIY